MIDAYRPVLYWCHVCHAAIQGNEVWPVGCPHVIKSYLGHGNVGEDVCDQPLIRVEDPAAEAAWRLGGDAALMQLLLHKGST